MAGGTPFHPYLDSFNLHILVEWSSEVVVFIFIFICCSMQNYKLVEITEGKDKRANPVSALDTGALHMLLGLSEK